MEVYFKSNRLRKQCSSETEMIKSFGKERAQKLMQRLMELDAAFALSDVKRVPPARCHELRGRYKGVFSVDLEHPYRLLFIPADDPPASRLEDGGLDWSAIQAVEIIKIEDTH